MAVVALFALAGCARPTGDFGRSEPDLLHDEAMPAIGKLRASVSKEPVSAFNLADEEQEMRDRVWRYLIAPHSYDWFGDVAAELSRTRIDPVPRKQLPKDRYYAWLHGTRFATAAARYTQISDDVLADSDTIPATFASICAVIAIDRQRGIAANGIDDLDDKTRRDASARQAENEMVIGWFVRALANRYDSYSYALDHLLVETPHKEAVRTDSTLSDLAISVSAAEHGDFCGGAATAGRSGEANVRSRFARPMQATPVSGS